MCEVSLPCLMKSCTSDRTLLGEGVADDDVGVHLLEQLDHLGFARRHFDVVVRGEKLGHEIHDLRIVVDDEHRPAVC